MNANWYRIARDNGIDRHEQIEYAESPEQAVEQAEFTERIEPDGVWRQRDDDGVIVSEIHVRPVAPRITRHLGDASELEIAYSGCQPLVAPDDPIVERCGEMTEQLWCAHGTLDGVTIVQHLPAEGRPRANHYYTVEWLPVEN